MKITFDRKKKITRHFSVNLNTVPVPKGIMSRFAPRTFYPNIQTWISLGPKKLLVKLDLKWVRKSDIGGGG